MPHSRKRPGHHEHHPAPAVSPRQRTKGRTILAILFAIFGLTIAFFAAGSNVPALVAGALIGAFIGYFLGRNMEQDMSHK